jgi:hypothetical protein
MLSTAPSDGLTKLKFVQATDVHPYTKAYFEEAEGAQLIPNLPRNVT